MAKEHGLEELKQEYKKLQEKHGLPDFGDLNREFYIEKIAESETDFLFREIRKFIADKIYNYMRLIETIINPSNSPAFIFSFIKTLTAEDRKKLNEIYERLSETYFEIIKMDIETSEKKDADFIKTSYSFWMKIKKELMPILEKMKLKGNNEENSSSKYFG